MTTTAVVAASFLGLALVLAVFLVVRIYRMARLRAVGVWVTGRVATDHSGDDALMVVEWDDQDGHGRHTTSSLSSSFLPQLDEPARVIYDPANWRRSEIAEVDRLSRWLSVIAIVVSVAIGSALFLLG